MSASDLSDAAGRGNIVRVMQLLVMKKVNVNCADRHYGSALGAAAYWGKEEVMALLLQRGADVNSTGGSMGLY